MDEVKKLHDEMMTRMEWLHSSSSNNNNVVDQLNNHNDLFHS